MLVYARMILIFAFIKYYKVYCAFACVIVCADVRG